MTTKKKPFDSVKAAKQALKKSLKANPEKITGGISHQAVVPFELKRDDVALILSPAGNNVVTTCGAIYDKLKKSFDTQTKTPFIFRMSDGKKLTENYPNEEDADPLAYASAIGQFREDHTGPALTKKFISDVLAHVPLSETPSIVTEVLVAFRSKCIEESKNMADQHARAAKEHELAQVTVKRLESFNDGKA